MKVSINLEKELEWIRRRKYNPQEALLREAKEIIRTGISSRAEITSFNTEDSYKPIKKRFSEKTYHLDHIRTLCIKYRLRFLDLTAFSEPLPPMAIRAMYALEKKIGFIPEYKMVAPASFFRLRDRDKDPLLFARLDDDNYILVAQWGQDLPAWRKIVAYPTRSLETFIFSLAVLAGVLSMALPADWLVTHPGLQDATLYYRALFFCWFMIGSFFFTIFLGMAFRKNFNDAEWNSRFFN